MMGILPIKNEGYEYTYLSKVSDRFSQIAPRYIQEAPGNAYESGGVYQYVLIDVETHQQ